MTSYLVNDAPMHPASDGAFVCQECVRENPVDAGSLPTWTCDPLQKHIRLQHGMSYYEAAEKMTDSSLAALRQWGYPESQLAGYMNCHALLDLNRRTGYPKAGRDKRFHNLYPHYVPPFAAMSAPATAVASVYAPSTISSSYQTAAPAPAVAPVHSPPTFSPKAVQPTSEWNYQPPAPVPSTTTSVVTPSPTLPAVLSPTSSTPLAERTYACKKCSDDYPGIDFPKMTKGQLENHGRESHRLQEHELESLFPKGGFTCQMCAASMVGIDPSLLPKYDKEQLEDHGRRTHRLLDDEMEAHVSSSVSVVLKANGYGQKTIERALSQVATAHVPDHFPTVGRIFAPAAPQPTVTPQVAGSAPSTQSFAPAQSFAGAPVFEAIIAPRTSAKVKGASRSRATTKIPKSKSPSKRKTKNGYTASKGYTCHICTSENRWKKQTSMDIAGLMVHGREKHNLQEAQLEEYFTEAVSFLFSTHYKAVNKQTLQTMLAETSNAQVIAEARSKTSPEAEQGPMSPVASNKSQFNKDAFNVEANPRQASQSPTYLSRPQFSQGNNSLLKHQYGSSRKSNVATMPMLNISTAPEVLKAAVPQHLAPSMPEAQNLAAMLIAPTTLSSKLLTTLPMGLSSPTPAKTTPAPAIPEVLQSVEQAEYSGSWEHDLLGSDAIDQTFNDPVTLPAQVASSARKSPVADPSQSPRKQPAVFKSPSTAVLNKLMEDNAGKDQVHTDMEDLSLPDPGLPETDWIGFSSVSSFGKEASFPEGLNIIPLNNKPEANTEEETAMGAEESQVTEPQPLVDEEMTTSSDLSPETATNGEESHIIESQSAGEQMEMSFDFSPEFRPVGELAANTKQSRNSEPQSQLQDMLASSSLSKMVVPANLSMSSNIPYCLPTTADAWQQNGFGNFNIALNSEHGLSYPAFPRNLIYNIALDGTVCVSTSAGPVSRVNWVMEEELKIQSKELQFLPDDRDALINVTVYYNEEKDIYYTADGTELPPEFVDGYGNPTDQTAKITLSFDKKSGLWIDPHATLGFDIDRSIFLADGEPVIKVVYDIAGGDRAGEEGIIYVEDVQPRIEENTEPVDKEMEQVEQVSLLGIFSRNTPEVDLHCLDWSESEDEDEVESPEPKTSIDTTTDGNKRRYDEKIAASQQLAAKRIAL